mmetsp:Transcript_2374/g.6352  ORF Transcript_2374/g.6352 Transcript_2374/m.6352 type:complete len:82 (+) Transcript_2374:1408-1653(+)
MQCAKKDEVNRLLCFLACIRTFVSSPRKFRLVDANKNCLCLRMRNQKQKIFSIFFPRFKIYDTYLDELLLLLDSSDLFEKS